MNKTFQQTFFKSKNFSLVFLALILSLSVVFTVSPVDAQKRGASKNKIFRKKPPVRKHAERDRDRDREDEESEQTTVIKRNGKTYYLTADKDLARYDQPSEAQEWFLKKRLAKGEKTLSPERYLTAMEKIKKMKRYSSALNKIYPSKEDAPNLEAELSGKSAAQNAGGVSGGVLGTWKNLGPGNIGGRTRSILINPTNTNIMYIGAVDGGVWKSTDGGASWSPLDDFLPNIAVVSLAFDPTNYNIIYAGTGEGVFNGDAVRGAGIFKTTDAGATWTRLAATANNTNFYYVNDVVVSNVNAQHVYAATRTGVQRSLDGGATWTTVLASNAANGSNGAMDFVIRTDQSTDYIFAAVGTLAQSHIFRNTDAGGAGTWTDVYTETTMGRTSLAIAPSNQNIIYALAAQTGATVAPAATYNDGLLGVFRSAASGDTGTWTTQVRNNSVNKQDTLLLSNPVNGALTECGFGTSQYLNQGWYDNQIAVDPTDSDKVWAAGIDAWRSDNGGVNWGVASYWWFQGNGIAPNNGDPQLVHADNHAIVFDPNYNGTTNQNIYFGDDGGLYKSTNAKSGNVGYVGGTTPGGGTITSTSPICGNEYTPGGFYTVPNPVLWSPLNNGYQVTQFNHGLPYPNGATYFGGTQDNGTNRGTDAGGTNQWERINGGDGGYVAVDPTNTNTLYLETTALSLRKSTNGGTSFASAVSGISGDTFPFYTVFMMDPSNPNRLWIGGRFMWRTDNAAGTWVRTSATQQTGGSITAIAIAPTNSDIVINGAASGQLRRTTTGTTLNASSVLNTVWLQSFTPRGNGNGTISWIAYDPTNANNVYVTTSTFNGVANANGTNAGHVFKSADGGATWTLIDGTQTAGNVNAIPDIPAHSVIVDPNNTQRLYVGTDLGVFVSLDGGANWAQETTGFSNVVTESLSILNNSGVSSLFAFTHGRSAYKVTIPASCTTVAPITQFYNSNANAGTVSVVKNAGATATCDWNAISNSSFITINSVTNNLSGKQQGADLSGTDNGTVNFTLTPNNTGAGRTGTITVAGTVVTINQSALPTAATVKIGGRAMNAKGAGIANVRITLTDLQGKNRTAVTSSFGYYSFDNVTSGSTYTLSAAAKGLTFSQPTQLVNVTEENNGINFISSSKP